VPNNITLRHSRVLVMPCKVLVLGSGLGRFCSCLWCTLLNRLCHLRLLLVWSWFFARFTSRFRSWGHFDWLDAHFPGWFKRQTFIFNFFFNSQYALLLNTHHSRKLGALSEWIYHHVLGEKRQTFILNIFFTAGMHYS
jgi:hypothetical protein